MATSKIKIKKLCEWCGKEFLAQKLSTRFCCKQCNEHAYKAKKRKEKVSTTLVQSEQKQIQEVASMEYLSVREASILIGLSIRATYDLIYRGQLRASRLSSRLTRIRKADVEAMLSGNEYQKWSGVAPAFEESTKGTMHAPTDVVSNGVESTRLLNTEAQSLPLRTSSKNEITEFYTTKEILDKFGISNAWLFKMTKQHPVPKVVRMGKSYWSRKHIDALMKKRKPDATIIEWYSTEELMQKFGMSKEAVYRFVYENKIPKKRIKRQAYYSKMHVDMAKGLVESPKVEYYSMKEAMERFQMTRDQIYHYAKRFCIPKQMEGKYVKFAKTEMDAAFAGPVISLSPFSPHGIDADLRVKREAFPLK